MPRSYSEEFRIELYKADPEALGTKLAMACVEANLPAKYVAVVFKTTRMTIHSWFRGQPCRKAKCKTIEAFISLVNKDLADGRLPAKGIKDAKSYLEEMIGESI
jgi:hypothetical protein